MLSTTNLDAKLLDWKELRSKINFSGLLLGNGASRAVWEGFAYRALYDIAANKNIKQRLGQQDLELFTKFGDNRNFEQVLSALTTARLVNEALDLNTNLIVERYDSVQNALIEAVQKTHIPWAKVKGDVLQHIRNALRLYTHVYTTNYDLLVYWAIMHKKQRGFKDYFFNPPRFDLANTTIRGQATLVHYIHGALHLYRTPTGGTYKRSATPDENLLDLFGSPLESLYPLLIAEGTADDKLKSIYSSDYLSFAYSKLAHHGGPLCIFGSALSESDRHIVDAINGAQVEVAAVSLQPTRNGDIIKAKKANIFQLLPNVDLHFFDSTTHPLGDPALKIG